MGESMSKVWHIAAIALLLLMAAPALADDSADCKQTADPSLAIKACGKIIAAKKSKDDLVAAYTARGGAYLAKKDYDDAVTDYSSIISIAPEKKTTAMALRAEVYLAEDDWSVALGDLDAALKLTPNDASLYAIRSAAYRQKGDAGKADGDCKQAHDLDPKASC
jgi:tetratricopeptide (TPR) repeat protein